MSDQVRVLVCGGRDFTDRLLLDRVLSKFHAQWPIDLVIHGDQSGADRMAGDWAYNNGIQQARFRIDPRVWRRVGKKAGPIRNRIMLDLNPAVVIAFPGGTGTADMIEAALQRGVRVEPVGIKAAPEGAAK